MNVPPNYHAQQPRAATTITASHADGRGFSQNYNHVPAGLNSGAVPFTPNAPRQTQGQYPAAGREPSLEDQMASMRVNMGMQQQDRYSPNQHQMYAPQRSQQQYLQLQQQLVEQQLAAKQQQMELLRLQAMQQHNLQQQHQHQQQQQQAAAAQQRYLMSRYQQQHSNNSSYEAQQHVARDSMRDAQAASAHEHRQAAQANIQANLRQRQSQQLYQSMGLDGHIGVQHNYSGETATAPQQQHARQPSDHQQNTRTPLDQRSWRNSGGAHNWNRTSTPPVYRDGSPAMREGRPSSGTAESLSSARSRAMTPSIVIDDSASESSRAAFSDNDGVAAPEGELTPETSEDDIANSIALAKMLAAHDQQNGGGLIRVVTPVMQAPKAVPRALSLAAAPPNRAFTREAKSLGSALTNSGGLTLPPIQPRRQPKGQPTEFKDLNFQARIKGRLRKEAMSKLCASPRAASFATSSNSFGSRLSNSPSIAPIL